MDEQEVVNVAARVTRPPGSSCVETNFEALRIRARFHDAALCGYSNLDENVIFG